MSNTLKMSIDAIDEIFDTPKCSRNVAEILGKDNKIRTGVNL
jgi:hypothetical protein